MACRRLWECLLNLLNFLLTLMGLAMVGYGASLLVEWNTASSAGNDPVSPTSGHPEFTKFGRPLIVTISLSTSILDKLPKAWFIYLFIGVGVTLFVVSCFGCIAAVTRNGCCLSFYYFLVTLLILVELGAATFILFDHSWKDYIPADVTGNFDMIYDFLEHHRKIAKWVALGAVVLEIWHPGTIDHWATSSSNWSTVDQHPSSTVVYIQRLREKYGLDTSMFTYNSSGPGGYQQAMVAPAEENSRCTIL